MDNYIGKMLDNRYEILEVFGRGGMAVVYKAKCHRLNRFVAIKVLKDELAQDAEFLQRFRDESQAVAMLSHPNIVSVYDVSRTSDMEYIVMELIDGITLKDYLERRSPLDWTQTTFFALQIAKALEHAHSRGIIHRDIKPQNIMVLRDGTVKVTDFGIARQAGSNTYNLREAIGSVHYVSPEQAKGGHIDNRSDLYSLGVVMYEMLAGRLPFEGDTPLAVAMQHVNSAPTPPSAYVPAIPKTLEDIVMKAMTPQQAGRYHSATEMIRDMENFRNDPHYKIDVAPRNYGGRQVEQDPNETRVIKYSSEFGGVHRAQPPQTNVKRPAARPIVDEEPEEEYDPPRRRVSGAMIFTILAVMIFVVGAGFFIAAVMNPLEKTPGPGQTQGPDDSENPLENPDGEDQALEAPKLVGRDYQDVIADAELARQGIIVKEKERVYDKNAEVGEILTQDPKAGRSLGANKTIYVEVCKGPPATEMPDVVGQSDRKAELAVKNAASRADIQVEIKIEEEFSDDDAEGQVIRTDPKAEEDLSDGDIVTLYVSKGPDTPKTKAPNLLQWSIGDIENELKKSKLTMGTTREVDSSLPAGAIVNQYPGPGEEVDEGSAVNFEVSKGPKEPVKKDVTITQTFPLVPDLDDPEAPIRVVVEVDGAAAYEKEHYASEGQISVRLKALEGEHEVRILQNGATVSRQMVNFE